MVAANTTPAKNFTLVDLTHTVMGIFFELAGSEMKVSFAD